MCGWPMYLFHTCGLRLLCNCVLMHLFLCVILCQLDFQNHILLWFLCVLYLLACDSLVGFVVCYCIACLLACLLARLLVCLMFFWFFEFLVFRLVGYRHGFVPAVVSTVRWCCWQQACICEFSCRVFCEYFLVVHVS